jgi:hypothetical protein
MVRQDLAKLVAPIVGDQRSRVPQIRADLEQWRDRKHVVARMQELDAALPGLSRGPVVGDPREQVVSRVVELCDLGLRWCSLVESAGAGHSEQAGFQRARALRDGLSGLLPAAEASLVKLSVAEAIGPETSAAHVALRRFAAVRRMLNLPAGPPLAAAFDNNLLWRLRGGRSLKSALGARLLWLPDVRFIAEDDAPPEGALPDIAQALETSIAEQRTLSRAYSQWVARADFRFTEVISAALGELAQSAVLPERLATALADARAALSAEILATQAAIEQAASDGLLGDAERAEYSAVGGLDVNAVPDFPLSRESLARTRMAVADLREERLQEQRAEFDRLDHALASGPLAEAWSSERERRLAGLGGGIRPVDEWLAEMRQAVEDGVRPHSWQDPPHASETSLEAFQKVQASLARLAGIPNLDAWPHELADLKLRLSGREEDAGKLWAAWSTLKRGGSEPELRRAFEDLFFGIGFELSRDVTRVQLSIAGDYVDARMKMTPRKPPPVPQFGSDSGGEFEILCAQKRAGTDVLRSRLQERSRQQHPLIVLYFAPLTPSERRAAARVTSGRPVLIIDEALALFLAIGGGGSDDLFACTLPYARLNPYTTAGRVAPETARLSGYFGVEDEATIDSTSLYRFRLHPPLMAPTAHPGPEAHRHSRVVV